MFKKIVAIALLSGVTVAAYSQGYVGALRSFTRVAFDCPDLADCKHSGQGWKIYGGNRLSPSSVIDFGVGKIDSVEVSYLRFGGVTSQGAPTTVGYLDSVS